MQDFDLIFEEFMTEWLEEHNGEYTPDEAEDMLPSLYEEWINTPLDELDGLSPDEYFSSMTSASELIDAFVQSSEEGQNPSSLLLDRIVQVSECAPLFTDLIENNANPEIIISSMNLLQEMGEKPPVDRYIFFITTDGVDEGVRELAAEILKESAQEIRETVLALIPMANLQVKEILAEILVETEHDERIYELLYELFLSSDNTPFIAGLIARYGDERCVSYLYPALDDCNYMEFIEIRNAIESLGGVVDDEYRDFSDDEYYKAMKNLK